MVKVGSEQGLDAEALVGGPFSTRRAFIGRAAGAFAALSGGGVLLAGCGNSPATSGGGSSAGSSSSGAGAKSATIVNILPPQLGYVAEYIAGIDGFYKKNGVSVKVETARGSAPAIQAVLSGTALMCRCGRLESLIAIADRGAPIHAVAFTTRRSPLAIVSDKKAPLTKPADLKGKRIGIPSEGGTSETTLDLLIASSGLSTHDVPRQVTGFTPGTFQLVKKGRLAGFIIGATQMQQFRQAVPDATFMPTYNFVDDGENYIASAARPVRQQGRDRRLPRRGAGRDAAGRSTTRSPATRTRSRSCARSTTSPSSRTRRSRSRGSTSSSPRGRRTATASCSRPTRRSGRRRTTPR